MKKLFRAVAAAGVGMAVVGSMFAFAGVASAALTPSLSLSSVNGGSVEITVTGDPNASVFLYGPSGSTSIGTTGGTGSFTTVVSATSYGATSGSSVYVTVDGAQSVPQLWPASAAVSGTPTLSQSSVTVGLGQTVTVTSTGGGSLYLLSNSSPTTAGVNVNGTTVTVTGSGLGSDSAQLCYVGTSSNCTNLTITVQATSVTGISFSQSSVTLAQDAGQSVTVSGGNGTYHISSNTNTTVVSTNLSGNSLSLTALAAGGASISVCDSANTCGTLSVTVTSNGSTSSITSGSLTFSPGNPSVAAGQTISVTITGGSGYYISSNTNPSAVGAGMNGTTLTLSGSQSGSSSVTVCSTSNGCGTITVTVSGMSSSANGAISFSPTNPTVAAGQSVNVTLTGSSNYIVLTNTNPGIAQAPASISGSTLTITGVSAGTDQLTVCIAGGGGCGPLSVTVTGASASVPPPTITTTTTTPPPVTTVSGVTAATGAAAGTMLAQIQNLQTVVTQMLTQLQSVESQLATLAAEVNSGVSVGTIAPASTAATTATMMSSAVGLYQFSGYIGSGSTGADVIALQEYLAKKGFYSGPITGTFGPLTSSAVSAYQTAHGIAAVGYVGPSTRTALDIGE